MDAPLWLTLIIGCTLVCAATLGGCVWWFSRKLAELNLKLAKVDKARQFSGHQAAQARKQIEKLQAELVTQQQRTAGRVQHQPPAARQRAEQLDILLASADAVAASRPSLPANGFADTQPMPAAGVV